MPGWVYVVLVLLGALAGFLVPWHLDRRKAKPLVDLGRLLAVGYLSNHAPAEHRDIAAAAVGWRSPRPPTSAAGEQAWLWVNQQVAQGRHNEVKGFVKHMKSTIQ